MKASFTATWNDYKVEVYFVNTPWVFAVQQSWGEVGWKLENPANHPLPHSTEVFNISVSEREELGSCQQNVTTTATATGEVVDLVVCNQDTVERIPPHFISVLLLATLAPFSFSLQSLSISLFFMSQKPMRYHETPLIIGSPFSLSLLDSCSSSNHLVLPSADTGLSFLLLSKSLAPCRLPSWLTEILLLLGLLLREAACACMRQVFAVIVRPTMSPKKSLPKAENVESAQESSVLDLPELALECILEKLPPATLCRMACVCRCLRERCRSNHLWETHMNGKWARLMGHAAYREWQWFMATRRDLGVSSNGKSMGRLSAVSCLWPVSWLESKIDSGNDKPKSFWRADSIMYWYLALESGKFWFPAQVYNRENGHVGFLLSCYDADLSYDSSTDTFYARYPPHGRRTAVIEEGVTWERLRAPPFDSSAYKLHASDCLDDLRPGDHIEIQWRKSKDFPYADTVMLEFIQYAPGSQWRQTVINRKDHVEAGNEAEGFYGGIRKLQCKEEILRWKQLWPMQLLE
ncbi:hypothetical protein ACLOJK_000259 [Asimina triloba]